MKQDIPIIIKKNIPNLGEPGTITKARLGYVLNYLLPKGIVDIATPGKIKHINMLKQIQLNQLKDLENQAYKTKNHLEQIPKISIKKKVGDQKHIFGSVSEKDIINYIFNITGETLDKKQITIPIIKEVGIYTIDIKIIENIHVKLKLQILPDNINI